MKLLEMKGAYHLNFTLGNLLGNINSYAMN